MKTTKIKRIKRLYTVFYVSSVDGQQVYGMLCHCRHSRPKGDPIDMVKLNDGVKKIVMQKNGYNKEFDLVITNIINEETI